MKSVELKIIKEILHKIDEQNGACLYVGIHFPFTGKYIKLLNIEKKWLPYIFPRSYKDLKEITFDQASDYSTIDLWVVVEWSVIPEDNSIDFAQIHKWSILSSDNIHIYNFAIT